MKSLVAKIVMVLICVSLPLSFAVERWYSSSAPAIEQIRGTVVGITDGDTLTLLIGEQQQMKLRLSAVDAPESRQPFGKRAKEKLSDLAFNKVCSAVLVGATYDREAADVVCEGRDLALEMVQNGHAWVDTDYLKSAPQRQSALIRAMRLSQDGRLGLWTDKDTAIPPVPPWEWRAKEAYEASQRKTQRQVWYGKSN